MLSIEQRYNICLISEKYPNWTQAQLAQWAFETFQLSKIPSQGAISRMLAKKEVYMNSKEHEKGAIRIRNPTNVLVRRVLQEWISQSCWNGLPITLPILQETAQSIWYKLPDEHREGDGSFSTKWILNCISKMGLNINSLGNGMLRTPKVWSFEERYDLKQMLLDKNLNYKNIFTIDETLLAYNLPLDYSQYEKKDGNLADIDVATVMFCSNLDGSEKLNPLVIGKYDSYISFRNYFPDQPTDRVSEALLGQKMALRFDLSYHSNRKASLTSSLFHDWLVSWDKRLGVNNRNIAIILDDSASHRVINLRLKNIELIFTSSNSKFLPFNWGVLEEFKIRYRIKQYKALIELQTKIRIQHKIRNDRSNKIDVSLNNNMIPFENLMSPEQSKLTMSNAFKFIRESWNDIDSDTIKSSWKSSGIIPNDLNIQIEDRATTYRKNVKLLNEIDYLCDQYQCERKWDHDLLLNLNIETKSSTFLSIEELVNCSIIEKTENNPVGIVPQSTPTNFTYSPNIHSTNTITSINSNDGSITNSASPKATHIDTLNKVNKNTQKHGKRHFDNMSQNTIVSGMSGEYNKLNTDSKYAVNLDILLNSNINSFPKSDIFNVSNFIDKPTMFAENKNKKAESIVSSEMVRNKSADYLNNLIDSQIPLPSSSTIDTIRSKTNNTVADEVRVFPNFGLPDWERLPSTNLDQQNQYISQGDIPQLNFNGDQDDKAINSNSLLTNIDMAKSLGSILKNVLANELLLSPATMFELKAKYEAVLKVIKNNSTSVNREWNNNVKAEEQNNFNLVPQDQAVDQFKPNYASNEQQSFQPDFNTTDTNVDFRYRF